MWRGIKNCVIRRLPSWIKGLKGGLKKGQKYAYKGIQQDSGKDHESTGSQ
jgi:hypothetical protein